MQDLERLIEELLARDLRPNSREQLAAFRQELAARTLSDDDARYIRAFHARVVGGGAPMARDNNESAQAGPKSFDVDSLQAELARSRLREKALEADRDRLQRLANDLRKEIDALKATRN
jgi:hypothetical protein